MQQNALHFSFYGFAIQVHFQSEVVRAQLSQDFGHFLVEPNLKPQLRIFEQDLSPSFLKKRGVKIGYTRMCEVWQRSFFQRLLIYRLPQTYLQDSYRWQSRERHVHIQASSVEVFVEIASILILSAVGENLDSRGIMRLHAASIQKDGKNYCFWGFRRAGKSTLTLSFYASPDIKIFSDELTLWNMKTQEILPFPIRITMDPHPASQVLEALAPEAKNPRLASRQLLDQKHFMDIAEDRIATPGLLRSFFVMQFSPRNINELRNLSFISSLRLYVSVIMGLDLIQMAELFLRTDNVLTLLRILWNRCLLCWKISRISPQLWLRSGQLAEDKRFILESQK